MGIDKDSLSNPFNFDTTFVPNAFGGGTIRFFNDTGETIVDLTFATLLRPDLTTRDLALFSCNDANTPQLPNPFFLNCAINYDPRFSSTAGLLSIRFFGVDPPRGRLALVQDVVEGHNGIAPDEHFIVTLNDGFVEDPDGTGGWSDPSLFVPGGPHFFVLEINGVTATPEPGTLGMMFGALAGAGILIRRRRGRTAGLIPSGRSLRLRR
jgi:hypothetical protein